MASDCDSHHLPPSLPRAARPLPSPVHRFVACLYARAASFAGFPRAVEASSHRRKACRDKIPWRKSSPGQCRRLHPLNLPSSSPTGFVGAGYAPSESAGERRISYRHRVAASLLRKLEELAYSASSSLEPPNLRKRTINGTQMRAMASRIVNEFAHMYKR